MASRCPKSQKPLSLKFRLDHRNLDRERVKCRKEKGNSLELELYLEKDKQELEPLQDYLATPLFMSEKDFKDHPETETVKLNSKLCGNYRINMTYMREKIPLGQNMIILPASMKVTFEDDKIVSSNLSFEVEREIESIREQLRQAVDQIYDDLWTETSFGY